MSLLAMLTELFVSAFQITRPRPDQQKRVHLILGGLTLALLVGILVLILGTLAWTLHG